MTDVDMDANTTDPKDSTTTDESTSVDTIETSNNTPLVNCVRVKKFNAVAFWSYDIENDSCAICHNTLMTPCNILKTVSFCYSLSGRAIIQHRTMH